MKKFWMIAQEESIPSKPRVYLDKRYDTLEEAKEAAGKKCQRRGHKYVILEAIEVCQASFPPVVWKKVGEQTT